MIAVVQFPLTDLRSFIDDEPSRLGAPIWPIVHLPDDPHKAPFIRGFGHAAKRARGGVDEWPSEDVCCDISHALRFSGTARKAAGIRTGADTRIYCAFRRMFWDGQFNREGAVVGRAEVGVGVRLGEERGPLSSREVAQLLDGVLSQSVTVVNGRARADAAGSFTANAILGEAGSALARAYLRASSSKGARARVDAHSWWVDAASPLMIVEFRGQEEVEALPAGTLPVSLTGSSFDGIRVFLGRRRINNRERLVWFFEGGATGRQRDALRRLRINVTRLHAAISTLEVLSSQQQHGRLNPTSPGPKQNLTHCLSSYLPYLYQTEYQGFAWTDFLRAALTLSETLTPGQFATLRHLYPASGRGVKAQLDRSEAHVDAQRQAPVPIKWDVFIAYARADETLATELYELLRTRLRVFRDNSSLQLGDDFTTLGRAQQQSFMTVVLVRADSEKAYYLQSEVQSAIDMARVDGLRHRVIPVYIEGSAARLSAGFYGLNLKHGIELPSAADLPVAAEGIVTAWRNTKPAD